MEIFSIKLYFGYNFHKCDCSILDHHHCIKLRNINSIERYQTKFIAGRLYKVVKNNDKTAFWQSTNNTLRWHKVTAYFCLACKLFWDKVLGNLFLKKFYLLPNFSFPQRKAKRTRKMERVVGVLMKSFLNQIGCYNPLQVLSIRIVQYHKVPTLWMVIPWVYLSLLRNL